MPSPFPGMDPYLEKPSLWPDLHVNLMAGSQGLLSAQLRPKYLVRIEERVYIADESEYAFQPKLRVPDVEVVVRPGWKGAFSKNRRKAAASVDFPEAVIATTWFEEEIREAFLKIIDRESREVVTIIEFLSPTNKVPGSTGRRSFEEKRREVMHAPIHWVEIDLLRGARMVRAPRAIGLHEYLVHVSKADMRPRGLLYPIRLPQRLPVIPIPLKAGDADARLDLQVVLADAYDRAAYDLEIDYRKAPRPPLRPRMAAWADRLLRSKGLRPEKGA